jgi:hypothetical protein
VDLDESHDSSLLVVAATPRHEEPVTETGDCAMQRKTAVKWLKQALHDLEMAEKNIAIMVNHQLETVRA